MDSLSAPLEPFDDQDAVAANIRALMGRYRVSQARLAGSVGLSTRGMSERLSGKTNFTVRELGRIARFFGKSLGDVVTPLVLSLAIASFTERGASTPQAQPDVALQLSFFDELNAPAASVPTAPAARAGGTDPGLAIAHKEAA